MKTYIKLAFIILCTCSITRIHGAQENKDDATNEDVFYIINGLEGEPASITLANVGTLRDDLPTIFDDEHDAYEKFAFPVIGEALSETPLDINTVVTYLIIEIKNNTYSAELRNIKPGTTLYLSYDGTEKKKASDKASYKLKTRPVTEKKGDKWVTTEDPKVSISLQKKDTSIDRKFKSEGVLSEAHFENPPLTLPKLSSQYTFPPITLSKTTSSNSDSSTT